MHGICWWFYLPAARIWMLLALSFERLRPSIEVQQKLPRRNNLAVRVMHTTGTGSAIF
jgi:hypothetical protein